MAVKTSLKVKKKWFEIIAPAIFNEQPIGETLAVEKEKLIGKTIKANLMDLLRDIKKQHMVAKLRVSSFKDNKAVTELVSIEVLQSAIKRQVRRRRDKLEDSFVCRTSDNKLVRIKPLLLTAFNAKGSVQANLQRITRKIIAATLRKLTYESLMHDLVSQKLQNYLKDNLSKIYPLRSCDIRFCGIVDERAKHGRVVPAESDYSIERELFRRMAKKPRKSERSGIGEIPSEDNFSEAGQSFQAQQAQKKPVRPKPEESAVEID